MDALRNSKKICLLAVAILFLFTFFNLILNAPRKLSITASSAAPQISLCQRMLGSNPGLLRLFLDTSSEGRHFYIKIRLITTITCNK
jgi:hypothetical protein